MKIAGLIIGILLLIGGLIGALVCLALPSLTNNRINFNEAMVFFIPALLVLFFGFLVTAVSAIFVVRARKSVVR